MKKILVGLAAALPLLPLFAQVPAPSPSPAVSSSATIPANLSPAAAEVVKLARSGVSEDVVTAYARNSKAPFNLSADQVVSLKDAGISSSVLAAMLQHDANLRPPADLAAPTMVTVQSSPPQPVAAAQPQGAYAPAPVSPPPKPIVVEQAPPGPQLEVMPLAPGPGYVWIPGYWMWRNSAWFWVGGRWVLRPYPTAVWMDGHWSRHGRGWIWVGGRWR